MSRNDETAVQKAKARFRMFFIIAVVLLFVMAFLSSLGDAFIYILGGLSFFFSVLAWQSWQKATPEDFSHYDRGERGQSFSETFRATFRQEPKVKAPKTSPVVTQVIRRIVIVLVSVVGGLVVLGIVIVAITVNDDDEPEYAGQDAATLYNSGNYPAAYQAYRLMLAGNEGDADSYYWMANAKVYLDERDSALYLYDQALQKRPEMLEAAYGKALIYYNEKNYSRATDELRYVFDRSNEHMDSYLLQGDIYYVNQQNETALGYYERAYELGARSQELSHILAYIYDVKGDKARAIEFYKETLQYDPDIESVNQRLGELLPGEEGNAYRDKTQW